MSILSFILNLFFPKKCIFCFKLVDAESEICEVCYADLKQIDKSNLCQKCVENPCTCSDKPENMMDSCSAVFDYSGVIRDGIHRFKFEDSPELAPVFAKFIYDDIMQKLESERDYSLIYFVPMNKKKQKKRGYNQAELMAENLSSWLGIPIAENIITKAASENSQHKLKARDRFSAITGTFIPAKSLSNEDKRHILIIDDIITTGSTLIELAKIISEMGALKISAVTIAKTKKDI